MAGGPRLSLAECSAGRFASGAGRQRAHVRISPGIVRDPEEQGLATLGFGERATAGDIDAAFRRLVKLHHPDRFAWATREAMAAAHEAFWLLRGAYERLK